MSRPDISQEDFDQLRASPAEQVFAHINAVSDKDRVESIARAIASAIDAEAEAVGQRATLATMSSALSVVIVGLSQRDIERRAMAIATTKAVAFLSKKMAESEPTPEELGR